MKYSQLFGKTIKDTPKDSKLVSHQLLYQGGFIRESTAGRYYFLPLGERVQNKIINIVRKHMDASGAQELLTPVMHPLELWQETNRTSTAGFELMKVEDRRGATFVPGGTAEEMLVDVVRKFNISYKDLPFNLYQFSLKFRDELRARGGLLRMREFIMKDAYSFGTEEQFKAIYQTMWDTYAAIYKELTLKADVVAADNGYIGGDYCHEFVVESEAGESRYFIDEASGYAAHEDVAGFTKYTEAGNEEMKPRKDVEGKGIIGVAELAKFLEIPVEKTTKTILFENEKGEVIAAAVNGLYDINETKLKHILKCNELKLATPETVKRVTKAEVGYAGILNLPKEVIIIMDDSLRGRKNFECGANKTNYHSININFGRDIPEPEKFYDIAMAQAGYTAPDGKGKLVEKRGIEVGNIFQLGYHYSNLMKDAEYTGESGKREKYYMGCYGFGIGRTLATIVEKYHDDKGIIWPAVIAPYQVHLVSIRENEKAERLYKQFIEAGIEVLYDDREDISAGQKFADADLIGLPVRLVVSKKTGDQIEWKKRAEKESELIEFKEVINRLQLSSRT
ncbi:MAG: proline--tRNA ligase [Patescibacteria group bacterium]